MAFKQQFALRVRQSDDAEFRAYVQTIIDKFVLCGLVQTNDLNQINLSTVVRAGGGAAAGFVIFRFDDPLQATQPVFIKMWFGTSNSYGDILSIWVQIATGTDGNGNLTGKVSYQRRILAPETASYKEIEWQCVITGDADRIAIWLHFDSQWISQYYYQAAFIVERLKDAEGENAVGAAGGLAFFAWHYPIGINGSRNHTNQMLLNSDISWSEYNTEAACLNVMRYDFNSSFSQGKVSAFPVYNCKNGGLLFNPIISIMACFDRDYINDAETEIEVYGQTRTYRKFSYGAVFWTSDLLGTQQHKDKTRALILWED